MTRKREATLKGSRLARGASVKAATRVVQNKRSKMEQAAMRAAGGPSRAIHALPRAPRTDWRPSQLLLGLEGGGALPAPCPPWQHMLSTLMWLERGGSGTPARPLALSSSYLPFVGSPAPHQVILAL